MYKNKIILLVSLLVLTNIVLAEADEKTIDYSGDYWSRPKLTGDWGGARTDMAEHGVTLDFDATHVTQHLMSGGFQGRVMNRLRPDLHETESSAMFNMLLNVDTGKAGLWPGGFLRVRGEGRVGQALGIRAGGLMPSNSAALAPMVPEYENQDALALTEMMYAQFLSEQFGVAFGLLNTMEGDGNEFAGSLRSRSHFMNAGMLYSPVVTASVPATALGVMAIFLPNKNIVGQVGFLNSEDAAGYNPFERDEGTTFLTEWKFKYGFAGLPGAHTVGFTYGYDRNRLDIGADPRLQLRTFVAAGSAIETKADTWSLYYNGSQYIQGDEKGGWGVFVRGGVSDGHPNPIKWSTAFGLGGIGVGSWRPNDNWGIGAFALGASDEPIMNNLGITDELGVEAFYNVAVTPWAHVTADVQYVDPAISGVTLLNSRIFAKPEDSWVFNLRTNWNF